MLAFYEGIRDLPWVLRLTQALDKLSYHPAWPSFSYLPAWWHWPQWMSPSWSSFCLILLRTPPSISGFRASCFWLSTNSSAAHSLKIGKCWVLQGYVSQCSLFFFLRKLSYCDSLLVLLTCWYLQGFSHLRAIFWSLDSSHAPFSSTQ